jgi:carbon-monoxide dehydrogenase large subunit
VHLAAERVATRAKDLAAQRLEAAVEDLVLIDGYVQVIGSPDARISLGELARPLQGIGAVPTDGASETPGLAAEIAFQGAHMAFASGSHVVEVEIDPETGLVRVVRYVVGHDCGTMINPMLVEGQIHGAVAHGLGNALSERLHYDESGQPLVTTFMEYRIPAAAEIPDLILVHTESPSPLNPLGVKGAGEGGTLPAAAVVVSAVEDALRDFGATIDRHPLSSEYVRDLITAAN